MQHVSKLIRKASSDTRGMIFARDQRFNCPECQDTGFVKIAHPSVVHAYCNGVVPNHEPHCMTLCDCEVAQKKTGVDKVPLFGDAPWHINMNKPDWRDKARAYRG